VSRRDFRKDNGRLEGPYGVPAQYLTDAERAQIDRSFCTHKDGYGSTIIVGETPANAPVCLLCDRRFPNWPITEVIG
jgi:hypothetical protein